MRNNSSGNTASWIAAQRLGDIKSVRHNLKVPNNHETMGAIAAQWIGMLKNPKSTEQLTIIELILTEPRRKNEGPA